MKLTNEVLELGLSSNGGWSNKQLKLLGVKTPLRKGWKELLIGTFHNESTIDLFLKMKDAHLPEDDGSVFFACPHCNKTIHVNKIGL